MLSFPSGWLTSGHSLEGGAAGHRREFGFVLEERAICCDDVRVRASGAGAELPRSGKLQGDAGPLPEPTRVTSAYFEAKASWAVSN